MSTTVGDVQVRNAFVVTLDGVDGNLVATVINSGDAPVTVLLQFGFEAGGTLSTYAMTLAAGEVVSLGNPGVPQLVFHGMGVKPGGLLPVFVQYGSVEGKVVTLPVLDNSFAAYSTLTPSPTPTPTFVPTDVPTPKTSATAAPVTK